MPANAADHVLMPAAKIAGIYPSEAVCRRLDEIAVGGQAITVTTTRPASFAVRGGC